MRLASRLCKLISVGKSPILARGRATRIMFSAGDEPAVASRLQFRDDSRGSAPQRAQQTSRNDVTLNLAGTVPDAFDARVPPDPLQRQVAHQAHAALDLKRLVRDHCE